MLNETNSILRNIGVKGERCLIPIKDEEELLKELSNNLSLYKILADRYEEYGNIELAKFLRDLDKHSWYNHSKSMETWYGERRPEKDVYKCVDCNIIACEENLDSECSIDKNVKNFIEQRQGAIKRDKEDYKYTLLYNLEKIQFLLKRFCLGDINTLNRNR